MASVEMNVIHENPEQKPIGELFFPVQQNGIRVKIPALSSHWIVARTHTNYKALPISNGKVEESAALDEWLVTSQTYLDEMNWLLSLEHFRFWSNMVHNENCIASIVSFLQEAIPFYTPLSTLTSNEQILTTYTQIHQRVIKVICRLVTNRESEDEWIAKDHLANLLYTKFLISIPMLFDITIAYGRSNATLLTRLFKTLFIIEPKYKDDLVQSMEFSKKAFDMIQATIDENNNRTLFDDLAMYTLDCAASINILLEVYPEAIEMALKIKLEQSITNFYDTAMPQLFKQIYVVNTESPCLKYLSQARIELLGSFRCMSNFYLEKILTKPEDSIGPAEHFLEMLQEALGDHLFVVDYQRLYPILNDIDILHQACSELDHFKVDFIVGAYTSETKQASYTPSTNNRETIEENIQSRIAEHDIPHSSGYKNEDKRVQNVLDVLPDLKVDFVEKLLTRYENPELAIAAVLEGNLPPDLEEFQNRHLLYDDETESSSNVLNKFMEDDKNVVIKFGKRRPDEPRTFSALLDDKTHVNEMRKRYELLGLVSEDEYDDEYDDSFEAIAESESKALNALKKTGANNYVADEESDDEGEEEIDDTANGEPMSRDHTKDFCENPEMVRARLAQARNVKYLAKNKSKPAKPNDVIGKPKGQGQEATTNRNRQLKDVHKSSRANHNRRQGATWKRNRGMIPS